MDLKLSLCLEIGSIGNNRNVLGHTFDKVLQAKTYAFSFDTVLLIRVFLKVKPLKQYINPDLLVKACDKVDAAVHQSQQALSFLPSSIARSSWIFPMWIAS